MTRVRLVGGSPRIRQIAAAGIVVVAAIAFMHPAGAAAAALTVTSTRDGLAPSAAGCTLRMAIQTVDVPGRRTPCGRAGRGSNTIVLRAGRYRLTIRPHGGDGNSSGDLNVDGGAPLTITGAGERSTVIDAAGLGDRVLTVAGRARVTLSHLSVIGGQAPNGPPGQNGVVGASCLGAGPGADGVDAGSRGSGGGIFNAGTLVLNAVAVRGNRAGSGGAAGGAAGAGCSGGAGGAGGGAVVSTTAAASQSPGLAISIILRARPEQTPGEALCRPSYAGPLIP